MRPTDFGWALEQLRAGQRVARAGWNGKGMWLMLVPKNDWSTRVGPSRIEGARAGDRLPFIAMKTVNGELVPWLASQTDVLAEDWELAP